MGQMAEWHNINFGRLLATAVEILKFWSVITLDSN